MKLVSMWCVAVILCGAVMAVAQTSNPTKVALVKNSYSGSRGEPERSPGPDALAGGGLLARLERLGLRAAPVADVRLSPEEDRQYGAWNRMGLANGRLAGIVSAALKEGDFPVGLLANCNSLMGMLAGIQHSGPSARPLKVGLVWIDAHGDFNTPETTLSGMLGGMPVAVSAGLCLTRFRLQSGLDPALPFSYIVMVAVRDTDPLEQELIDRHGISMVSAEDIRGSRKKMEAEMTRLSGLTDRIYVHIDMDVLDPAEVSGHSLTVPGGPTSRELAAVLEGIFSNPKAVALGIASYPAERDPDKTTLEAAYTLIEGALRGADRISGR